MIKVYLFTLAVVLSCTSSAAFGFSREGADVFINEVHYDNTGTDRNEVVRWLPFMH